ncbi:Uncharacterized protein TCM_002545 [Theobroma cacao]|uniref:Uncharacterized protein n=1 Tax=Theobroma cacao TaxID=3641 RepID=A0A061DUM8_THECC|nr:Uncharacterized protein TCM_002545 [Theobroma cacao]
MGEEVYELEGNGLKKEGKINVFDRPIERKLSEAYEVITCEDGKVKGYGEKKNEKNLEEVIERLVELEAVESKDNVGN